MIRLSCSRPLLGSSRYVPAQSRKSADVSRARVTSHRWWRTLSLACSISGCSTTRRSPGPGSSRATAPDRVASGRSAGAGPEGRRPDDGRPRPQRASRGGRRDPGRGRRGRDVAGPGGRGTLLARNARSLARVADPAARQRAYALLARNGFDPEICRRWRLRDPGITTTISDERASSRSDGCTHRQRPHVSAVG